MTPNMRPDGTSSKITINPDAKANYVAHLFIGISLALGILSIPFPFFRGILVFGSLIMAVILSLGCMAAYDDMKAGVRRIKPASWGKSSIPKWFKIVFFLFMIGVTAGLRMGFFLTPVCWVVIWVMITSMLSHIEATFVKEETTT